MKEKIVLSKRLYQLRIKKRKNPEEMAGLMGITRKQYDSYEKGEYDEKLEDSRVLKRIKRLEELEREFEISLKHLALTESGQKGNVNEILADQQRQIDELAGKLRRVMDRLGMN